MITLMSMVTLLWAYPDNSVRFNIYEQTIIPPTPYWTNTVVGWDAKCGIVTTDWLTNDWTRIATTTSKRYFISTKNDGLIHCFKVHAQDPNTLIESTN